MFLLLGKYPRIQPRQAIDWRWNCWQRRRDFTHSLRRWRSLFNGAGETGRCQSQWGDTRWLLKVFMLLALMWNDHWWRSLLHFLHFLTVPRFWQNTFGRRAFSVGGPMAWNSLPDSLRDPLRCVALLLHRLSIQLWPLRDKWGGKTYL